MKHKLLNSLLVLVMLTTLLVSCGTPKPTETVATQAPQAEAPAQSQAPAASDGETLTYFEVNALVNLPYFIDHRLGLEYAGKVFDSDVKYVGPVDYDMTAMINAFE